MDETPSQHEAVQAVGEALSAIRESSIAELEVDWEGGSLRVHREPSSVVAVRDSVLAEALQLDDRIIITAEHVGFFHGGAGGPFPSAGAWVSAGTPLGEIETLGIHNVVTAPVDGRVDELLVDDGSAVEYGQRLATIRPEPLPPDPEPGEASEPDTVT